MNSRTHFIRDESAKNFFALRTEERRDKHDSSKRLCLVHRCYSYVLRLEIVAVVSGCHLITELRIYNNLIANCKVVWRATCNHPKIHAIFIFFLLSRSQFLFFFFFSFFWVVSHTTYDRYQFRSTMWSRWLVSLQMFLLYKCVQSMPGSSNNYKINPKPCTVNAYEGTCMFVWECIKSEGQHIGMCVDSFMFGSCCAHNLTENIVVPSHQVFDFKPPPKRPRPPPASASHPNRPHTGTSHTTIHRPHGGGTLVIRPSHTKRPGAQQHTHTTYFTHKPAAVANEIVTTTVKLPSLSENTVPDLDTASSISTGMYSTMNEFGHWRSLELFSCKSCIHFHFIQFLFSFSSPRLFLFVLFFDRGARAHLNKQDYGIRTHIRHNGMSQHNQIL